MALFHGCNDMLEFFVTNTFTKMLRVRETIKINGWTMTLVASKCVLGGDWSVGTHAIESLTDTRADWISEDRYADGVAALKAGRAWAEKTFG